MIQIKMKINSGDWITGLEKNIAKQNIGDIHQRIERELTNFELGSVSLYFYFSHDFIINTLNYYNIVFTDVIEIQILKNEEILFGGYVDNKSIEYDKKSYTLSMTVFAYRHIARKFDGEDIYDRILNAHGIDYKLPYRFKSANFLVNKIYDQISSYLSGRKVDALINSNYESQFSNMDSFIGFVDRSKLGLPTRSIYDITTMYDDNTKYCIYANDGAYRGDFVTGFNRITLDWHDNSDGGGIALKVENWLRQGYNTVTKPFAKRVPTAGGDINWYPSAVSYTNNREFAVGFKTGNYSWGDIYITTRTYSGGSWGAWSSPSRIDQLSSMRSPWMASKWGLWWNETTNQWYLMIRQVNGQVYVIWFNANGTYSNGSFVNTWIEYEPQADDRRYNRWIDVKMIDDRFMIMYHRWNNRIVVRDLEHGQWMRFDLDNISDGALLNMNVSQDSSCLLLNSDKELRLSGITMVSYGDGLLIETNGELLIKLDWNDRAYDDPDGYDPTELGFDGWEPSDNEEYDFWVGMEYRGFYNDNMHIAYTSRSLPFFDNTMLVSIGFNSTGNYIQYIVKDRVGETVIVDADFTGKSSSDVLKDLAKTACAIEYIDNNKIAHFRSRQNMLSKIYHFNSGTAANYNYGKLLNGYTNNIDFNANVSFTIECWCKLFETNSEECFLFGKLESGGATAGMYRIYTDSSGVIKAHISDGTNQATATGINILNLDDEIIYIAVVIDRNVDTMRIRVNDSWASSAVSISSVGSLINDGDLMLCRNHTGVSATCWKGFVREIKVTKMALSFEELSESYAEANGWITGENAVLHIDFNLMSMRDESLYHNSLKEYHSTFPPIDFYTIDRYRKVENITKYLKDKNDIIIWENYYEGIILNYSDGDVKVGQTTWNKEIFQATIPFTTHEILVKMIATVYLIVFGIKRRLLEIDIINYDPELFKFYQIDNSKYLCIDTITSLRDDSSRLKLVEVI